MRSYAASEGGGLQTAVTLIVFKLCAMLGMQSHSGSLTTLSYAHWASCNHADAASMAAGLPSPFEGSVATFYRDELIYPGRSRRTKRKGRSA